MEAKRALPPSFLPSPLNEREREKWGWVVHSTNKGTDAPTQIGFGGQFRLDCPRDLNRMGNIFKLEGGGRATSTMQYI